jgi:DNA-3-methyladenine glycosylase
MVKIKQMRELVCFLFLNIVKINLMKKKLLRKFYNRNTLTVAKELLGKYLIRKIGNKKIIGKIVETEAYVGPKDKASHAFGNKMTERNKAEYLDGGHIYIYLVYGMYWQFNISTRGKGKPECVLIRALEPIITKEKAQSTNYKKPKKEERMASGPGKLCKWMALDKSFYGEDIIKSGRLWMERGEKIKSNNIVADKRIGIDYAGPEWAEKKWRFFIRGNDFVSKK